MTLGLKTFWVNTTLSPLNCFHKVFLEWRDKDVFNVCKSRAENEYNEVHLLLKYKLSVKTRNKMEYAFNITNIFDSLDNFHFDIFLNC
jgi:hypothetical protein